MPHQDRLGNNGTESTGLTKSDDGDDRMQKNGENVAHAPDGIKLQNPKNSVRLRNSPTTGPSTAGGAETWKSSVRLLASDADPSPVALLKDVNGCVASLCE